MRFDGDDFRLHEAAGRILRIVQDTGERIALLDRIPDAVDEFFAQRTVFTANDDRCRRSGRTCHGRFDVVAHKKPSRPILISPRLYACPWSVATKMLAATSLRLVPEACFGS